MWVIKSLFLPLERGATLMYLFEWNMFEELHFRRERGESVYKIYVSENKWYSRKIAVYRQSEEWDTSVVNFFYKVSNSYSSKSIDT